MNKQQIYTITGVLVDPIKRSQKGVEIHVRDGRIESVKDRPDIEKPFILPGFIDAHVHIESSLLIPSQFAHLAVRHGTVGVVTDPHEVANVAGIDGVEFMIEDGKSVPLEFFFGAPSCVPASPMEVSGAVITGTDVAKMLASPDFYYLSEMMNFPGVVHNDTDVWHKLDSARKYGKPIDGHAPGLSGDDLVKYARAGITTDHECSTIEEAYEKISNGMKILIREGSAAKNFNNLIPIMQDHSDMVMFCTDDCHPDYLLDGHINKLASKAVKAGYDVYDVLRVACISPVEHYKLPVGLLKTGHRADFVVVEDLEAFDVIATYINGIPVFENGKVNFSIPQKSEVVFPFRKTYPAGYLKIVAQGGKLNVIEAVDGELVTNWKVVPFKKGAEISAQPENDLLKIVLLDRYSESLPVVAFIRGFGLKKGAIACSVAHDSHHMIAVGCDDESLDSALQWLVDKKGGLCVVADGDVTGLALPYYGLMSGNSGDTVAREYTALSQRAKACGSTLSSPFMTLSFMALTVIPNLKINHNGLFDGVAFKSISLFSD